MNLFEESLQNLGNKASVLSDKETDKVLHILQRVFPFICSNIDWTKNNNNQTIASEYPEHIIPVLEKLLQKPLVDKTIYVVWDRCFPGIKTDLDTAVAYLDDITISTRTWLFNPEIGYVVEWHCCGNKTIGIASHERLLLGKALKDCVDALIDDECRHLSLYNSKQIFKLLKNKFGFSHMVVDWDIISTQRTLQSPADIIQNLEQLVPVLNKSVYLLWDKVEELPVFEANLDVVIEHWDKVMNAGSLSYILDLQTQYVIGLYKDKVLVGLTPKRH